MNRERLVQTFMELVQIDSESKNEGPFQAALKQRLEELGLYVHEDDSKNRTGLGSGNLYARLDGQLEAEPIFFSCHVDTVAPGNGIKPSIEGDRIVSDGSTILAADDKAGIAAILEAIARLKENNTQHRTLEFVFSPGEEIGLIGAAAYDTSQLIAKYGYVLDGGGPVGAVTMGSPTLNRMEFTIKGSSAHAGLEPEKGISAITIAARAIASMRLGRISDSITANIGTIAGGTATNIVADHAEFTAEARAIYDEDSDAIVKEMIHITKTTAEAIGGQAEAKVSTLSQGYALKETDLVVRQAFDAIRALGREPHTEISGGGSDANIFNAAGKPSSNLSIGYEDIHTLHEYMPIAELERAAQLVYHLASRTEAKHE